MTDKQPKLIAKVRINNSSGQKVIWVPKECDIQAGTYVAVNPVII